MSDQEVSEQLDILGYNVPVIALRTGTTKARHQLENWIAFRRRHTGRVNGQYRSPGALASDFLAHYRRAR